jgi:hypothetical protein
MNPNEMSFEKQVGYLRSLLTSGKGTLTGFMALFAFRHHLASKHSPNFSQSPVLRLYLGQLAKEYIKGYYNQAKSTLEDFAEIGLLEAKGEAEDAQMEFHLNEALFPALQAVLEEVFGKEAVANAIVRAKYYRNRAPSMGKRYEQNPSAVEE